MCNLSSVQKNKVCKECTKSAERLIKSLCYNCYRKNWYYLNLKYEQNRSRIRGRLIQNNNKKRILKNKYQNKFARTSKAKFSYGKRKAKSKELDFKISIKDYEKLISKGCHYCNKNLFTEVGVSLDRIDNTKGYIKSNVIPCCGDHNKLRGNYLSVKETEVAVCAILALKNKGKFSINGWKIVVK